MTHTTQSVRILEALIERGWQCVDVIDGEWWADEVVVLQSTWSPAGSRLVLTFLVDPQHDGPRRKGEHVWAVVASKEIGERSGPTLGLGSGWEERLPEFLRAVDALRAS